jgi:hypothetical protein
VTVKNTGKVAASEVVQLYLKWLKPNQETPKIQLVNFDKIFLKAGEQTAVTLEIDARHMAMLHVPTGESYETLYCMRYMLHVSLGESYTVSQQVRVILYELYIMRIILYYHLCTMRIILRAVLRHEFIRRVVL